LHIGEKFVDGLPVERSTNSRTCRETTSGVVELSSKAFTVAGERNNRSWLLAMMVNRFSSPRCLARREMVSSSLADSGR
jgi:hypothetical protein